MKEPRTPRAGFTLVELLVVLAILAALATVALRSVQGLADQARFDATQRALDDLRRALLGRGASPGAHVDAEPGFLGDLARLPDPTVDPARPLLELWQRPAGVASSALALSNGIALPTGWRGPYLDLPPGASNALDGWGWPLQLDTSGGRWAVRSLGADGLAGGSGYEADLELVITDPAQGIDLASAALAVELAIASDPVGGGWTVSLSAFAPDPATGGLAEIAFADQALGATSFPCSLSFALAPPSALTPGLRVLRAELHKSGSPSHFSAPISVALKPGGNLVAMELP